MEQIDGDRFFIKYATWPLQSGKFQPRVLVRYSTDGSEEEFFIDWDEQFDTQKEAELFARDKLISRIKSSADDQFSGTFQTKVPLR